MALSLKTIFEDMPAKSLYDRIIGEISFSRCIEEELTRDLMALLASFSGKYYGK